MQYSVLGSSGLLVSRLAFGAMTFTQGNDDPRFTALYTVDGSAADRLVGHALDAGVNFFDTADAYAGGESERVLGKALHARRNDVIIGTKVGMRTGLPKVQAGLSRRHILWSAEQSLKRLGTDWIDLYVVHCEDPLTPLHETLQALDTLVRSGKVRAIGFSNWSAWKVAAAIEIQRAEGWTQFSHGQLYYSLVGRDIEADFMPLAEQYGLGISVWSPLAGGFLTGKYRTDASSASNGRLTGFDVLPFDREQGHRVLTILNDIAHDIGASVAQIALAWLLRQPGVSSLLIGATRGEQLAQNLAALDVRLSVGQIELLQQASRSKRTYPHWVIERNRTDRLGTTPQEQ